jgi:hypothetical protein
MSIRVARFAAAALAVTLVSAGSLADGDAAKVTADKVRAQGFPCAEPVSAQRDPAASKPDEEVWILECSDARYRVRLMQDMPAKIERLQ